MTRGTREPLPTRRRSERRAIRLDGMTIHLTLGFYDDGRLAEIFLDTAKEGAFSRGILNGLARAVSAGLQHGVPAKAYVKAFSGAKFEPANLEATSALDAIAKELEQFA